MRKNKDRLTAQGRELPLSDGSGESKVEISGLEKREKEGFTREYLSRKVLRVREKKENPENH